MAQYEGMDRFTTGKALAHRKAEIQATTASVVRVFKSNGIVDETDLVILEEHVREMRKAVEFWNLERLRELGKVVRTP